MAVYKIVYYADEKKYEVLIKASSQNQAEKRIRRFFEKLQFDDAYISFIQRID